MTAVAPRTVTNLGFADEPPSVVSLSQDTPLDTNPQNLAAAVRLFTENKIVYYNPDNFIFTRYRARGVIRADQYEVNLFQDAKKIFDSIGFAIDPDSTDYVSIMLPPTNVSQHGFTSEALTNIAHLTCRLDDAGGADVTQLNMRHVIDFFYWNTRAVQSYTSYGYLDDESKRVVPDGDSKFPGLAPYRAFGQASILQLARNITDADKALGSQNADPKDFYGEGRDVHADMYVRVSYRPPSPLIRGAQRLADGNGLYTRFRVPLDSREQLKRLLLIDQAGKNVINTVTVKQELHSVTVVSGRITALNYGTGEVSLSLLMPGPVNLPEDLEVHWITFSLPTTRDYTFYYPLTFRSVVEAKQPQSVTVSYSQASGWPIQLQFSARGLRVSEQFMTFATSYTWRQYDDTAVPAGVKDVVLATGKAQALTDSNGTSTLTLEKAYFDAAPKPSVHYFDCLSFLYLLPDAALYHRDADQDFRSIYASVTLLP